MGGSAFDFLFLNIYTAVDILTFPVGTNATNVGGHAVLNAAIAAPGSLEPKLEKSLLKNLGDYLVPRIGSAVNVLMLTGLVDKLAICVTHRK